MLGCECVHNRAQVLKVNRRVDRAVVHLQVVCEGLEKKLVVYGVWVGQDQG